MTRRASWLWLAATALAPVSALAQDPPPAPAPAIGSEDEVAAPQVEQLTVTSGQQQEARTTIDRASYNIANDLSAQTGAVSDALRNIPSVTVDVQGNVTVRGEAVTFMIDGRPAPELQGPNGAAMLQTLPTNRFERVEVATNPSAAERPEGGAVINLVTRQGRGAGQSWQLRANLSDRGRSTGGVYGTYNSEKLALNGDIGFRTWNNSFVSQLDRTTIDPNTGVQISSGSTNRSRSLNDNFNTNGSATYDLDKDTRLSANLRYSNGEIKGLIDQERRVGAIVNGLNDRWSGNFEDFSAALGYRRKYDGQDHDLALDLRHARGSNISQDNYTQTGPAAPPTVERLDNDAFHMVTGLKGEYKRPMPQAGRLTLGAQVDVDDSDFDRKVSRGPDLATLAIDPLQSGDLAYDQTLFASWITYQAKSGKLTIMPGLRAEAVDFKVGDPALGPPVQRDYVEIYPTLHVEYAKSEQTKLSLSYSRRVQRPSPFQLNPGRFLNGDVDYTQGNPFLRPQFVEVYELGYDWRVQRTGLRATLYWRDATDVIAGVSTPLPGGGILNSLENAGGRRAGGIDLTANHTFSPKLKATASSTVLWAEYSPTIFSPQSQSGTQFNIRTTVDWTPTPNNTFQLAAIYTGKQVTPQGYSEPVGFVNLGYRRKVNDKVSALVTVSDAFKTQEFKQVIRTPQLQQLNIIRPATQVITVGLAYTFGGTKERQPPAFEFAN